MNRFHWIEAKQLDRVTNFSTEIEPLKYANTNNIQAFYYCTFTREKKYFGLKSNIHYLGQFKNRYLKAIEFHIRVIIKAIRITLSEKNSVLMVNQDLVRHMLPAVFMNQVFGRKNKFITDIRTTPTDPDRFNSDMKTFHSKFKLAVKHFDGFSFITPFMEKYIMKEYGLKTYRSLNWSSGVDTALFDPAPYSAKKDKSTFQLLYHGGISISRGNLELIKAIWALKKAGYPVELLQLGICVDNEIKDYIEENKLQEWCKLLPPVDIHEIPAMIANADLPILPFPYFDAWRVSSPIKLMEYLAMGKKVMVPDMEAFTDVFGFNSDLVFYFNARAENPSEEIKKELKSIFDNKKISAGNFTPEARDFVEKEYTWQKQSQKLFNFCENL